jgi:hypothetical protein
LHSCKDDRAQLNYVYRDLLDDPKLREALGGFKLKALPNSGDDKGTLRNNYRSALRFLNEELEQEGVDRIRMIYSKLLNDISVVQIDVWDPTNGPKIFDSLNSRQEPMTIGDLIRNEIFARVASAEVAIIEHVDAEHWQPFYRKFDQNGRNLFDGYFFPYGLIKRPNLKKSEVYASLRKDWDGPKRPEEIIDQLAEYQDAFIDIHCGSNLCCHPKLLAAAFARLHATGLPSSTFPFLMQLSRAASLAQLSEEEAVAILDLVETFLVRRATCGHEPTGLHAVFKRLWADCAGEFNASKVALEISKHRTVVWPSRDDFAKAVETRNLYGVNIAPYLIAQFDRSAGGDAHATIQWIEHVLPTNPDDAWFADFSKEEHEGMKDRLANLIPLSVQMNQSLGNKPYQQKRARYSDDSVFKSTRKFAEEFEIWSPQALAGRARMLADWALTRWPHDRVDS